MSNPTNDAQDWLKYQKNIADGKAASLPCAVLSTFEPPNQRAGLRRWLCESHAVFVPMDLVKMYDNRKYPLGRFEMNFAKHLDFDGIMDRISWITKDFEQKGPENVSFHCYVKPLAEAKEFWKSLRNAPAEERERSRSPVQKKSVGKLD